MVSPSKNRPYIQKYIFKFNIFNSKKNKTRHPSLIFALLFFFLLSDGKSALAEYNYYRNDSKSADDRRIKEH